MSTRLEAPITITLSSDSTPSSSERNWGTIVVSTSEETPEPRVRSSESISSMNTTTGLPSAARSRARWKIRANQSFGFTDVFVEQFRALDGQEHALDMGFGRTDCAVAIRIVTTLA